MEQIIISDKIGERFTDRIDQFLFDSKNIKRIESCNSIVVLFVSIYLICLGVWYWFFTDCYFVKINNNILGRMISVICVIIGCVGLISLLRSSDWFGRKRSAKFRLFAEKLTDYKNNIQFKTFHVKYLDYFCHETEIDLILIDGSSFWKEDDVFFDFCFGYRLTIPEHPDICFALYPQVLHNVKEVVSMKKAASLSPMIVQEDMIEKWDGKMPQIVGGNGMMLDISKVLGKQ